MCSDGNLFIYLNSKDILCVKRRKIYFVFRDRKCDFYERKYFLILSMRKL